MEKNNEFFKQLDQTETLFLENEKIAEVIKSVIMSKLLFLTKEGKIYSHLAEEYIRELNGYAIYCKDGKQEKWKELVRKIVYASGNGSDESVLFELESFERTGIIMKMQDEGANYEELHNYFFENACESGTDQILFGLKMLEFAKDGRKFIEEHYSDNLPCKKNLLNFQSGDEMIFDCKHNIMNSKTHKIKITKLTKDEFSFIYNGKEKTFIKEN